MHLRSPRLFAIEHELAAASTLPTIGLACQAPLHSHNPDAVFVDGTGIGWGVHDRLNQLGCPNLVGVDFGARADRTDASDAAARYANKRAEMWGFMKEWLKAGCPTTTSFQPT
jgi:hypothetical protein